MLLGAFVLGGSLIGIAQALVAGGLIGILVAAWIAVCGAVPGGLLLFGFQGLVRHLGRLGEAVVTVEPRSIRDGDAFSFHYQKRVQPGSKRLSLSTALVLREKLPGVRNGESTTTIERDHLVAEGEAHAFDPSSGGLLESCPRFAIPRDGVMAFDVEDPSPRWIVRASIQAHGEAAVWEDFEILTTPYPPRARDRVRAPLVGEKRAYELLLVRAPRRTLGGSYEHALAEILPHLNPRERLAVHWQAPVTIIHTSSLEEARQAFDSLTAVGCSVELRRGDDLIAATLEGRLPIPGDAPAIAIEQLPRTADPGVSAGGGTRFRTPPRLKPSGIESDTNCLALALVRKLQEGPELVEMLHVRRPILAGEAEQLEAAFPVTGEELHLARPHLASRLPGPAELLEEVFRRLDRAGIRGRVELGVRENEALLADGGFLREPEVFRHVFGVHLALLRVPGEARVNGVRHDQRADPLERRRVLQYLPYASEAGAERRNGDRSHPQLSSEPLLQLRFSLGEDPVEGGGIFETVPVDGGKAG
jgi:hypothetical protein